MSQERNQRIRETMGTPGWPDIAAILDELIQETEADFSALLAREPEKINLRTAQKYAVRAKAFKDFRESIMDTQRAIGNNPQPPSWAGRNRAA